MYHTHNTAGGVEHHRTLSAACKAATDHFGDGYIHNAKGRRPVIDATDGSDGYHIGEYGQSYKDLVTAYADADAE